MLQISSVGILLLVIQGPPNERQTFIGVVHPEPTRHFTGSPVVSFPVTVINVEVGQFVRKEETLLELDPAPLPIKIKEAQLAATKADLPTLERRLRRAEQDADGIAELHKLGYRSQADRDNARIQASAAEAAVVKKYEAIAAAELVVRMQNYSDQNYARMRSPISGTVVAVNCSLGQVARAQDEQLVWIEIIDFSVMEVHCWVQLKQARELQADSTRKLVVTEGEFNQVAQVKSVGRVLNDKGQVRMILRVRNTNEHLLVGMKTKVAIE